MSAMTKTKGFAASSSSLDMLKAVREKARDHTPGPWRVDAREDEVVGRPTWPCTRHGKAGEWTVATVEDLAIVQVGAGKEARANANLIAAAPELLTELCGSACPRPANRRPDDFTAGQCVGAGECGCSVGVAIAKALGLRLDTAIAEGGGE